MSVEVEQLVFNRMKSLSKRPRWELKSMEKALGAHSWLNTGEEDLTLRAITKLLSIRSSEKVVAL